MCGKIGIHMYMDLHVNEAEFVRWKALGTKRVCFFPVNVFKLAYDEAMWKIAHRLPVRGSLRPGEKF